MSGPLVSIVVPVYNGAKYLRQALDSVVEQTYQHLQLIVVDDGSTDTSPDVIASYGPRVLGIRQPNAGVASARNAGIRAAAGEFIGFLDQDDWWAREKVERQVAYFQRDPALGLVHTGILQFSEAAQKFVDNVYSTTWSSSLQGNCYERLVLGNAVYNSTVMIRKSVLVASGMFDPAIPGNTVQDYDLWLRIAKRYPLGYVPEQLAVLRLHHEQGSWDRRAMLGDELNLLERTLDPRALCGSPVMRARLARLLGALGVAHLHARARRPARQCFARALGLQWSRRAAMLYAISFLPSSAIEWVRRQKARWRGRAPELQTRDASQRAGQVAFQEWTS